MMEGLPATSWLVLGVFCTVYLGMILGGLPRLQLDRTGVALLGAIAIVGAGVMTPEAAAQAIHLPTILLLFSFMVISAQMRLGGFYGAVTRRIAALKLGPAGLMGVVVAASALLSAVFSNDIVCLAMAPLLLEACLRRRLDPVPFLLGLACASNIGSAATLIGNPQNMLIGEVLKLPFGGYALQALPPVLLGLLALWGLLAWQMRGSEALSEHVLPPPDEPPFDAWQTTKGLVVAGVLVVVFLFSDWPRDVAALVGAGLLLLSQRFHSSQVMGLIDWELLILFMGLFVVNAALEHSGLTRDAIAALQAGGVDLSQPWPLFIATLGLSNLVSNVPAVMLLLPGAHAPTSGTTLALVSTLAGNLLLVGSIANLIVIDAARRAGVLIDWRRHARTGVPVTLASLAVTALWLAWLAGR
ncbi:anion transporter [Pelomonas sp. SE-A7]|uniref:anion transporter n=1 Tax=Pelomonas sp. SE-A7 TaxID=3054953 RepID=UPI00259CB977|nr:anion transporter [Pelomonas sp. SE-A7]MDM4767825.1 anion transporter [Pelomonas sp. SE-A7]